MTHSEKQAWEQVRAEGKGKFILRSGLFRYGVRFGLIFGLFQIARLLFFNSAEEPAISIVATWGFATLCFGAVMGEYKWRQLESDYQKTPENKHLA